MRPRFLISRLSALGDVVCTLPAASALKEGFPDAEIVWAVDPRFAGIVECCSAVDQVRRVRPSGWPPRVPRIEGEFEAAFDLQGLLKSAAIVARAKARAKLGYHWQREGAWLFSAKVSPDPSSFHVVDQYVDVVRAVGGKADRAVFQLAPKSEDVEKVRGALQESGVTGRFVVLNPGAGWVTKRWPPAHFAALADALAGRGVDAVLIGGPAKADQEAAAEVIGQSRSLPANLAGKTSVRELVALIDLAAAHVGGDTGSTHIAAALGKPAIGLYSITLPRRSCPYGQAHRCHYDPAGLANIQPGQVLDTVLEAIA
ncbi:MAG: glycosyltransferase family 9 protein [Fimbriimonas ginsengisoli]|uniref:Glycosyltransferase family 9 protein n=1 Tax=Fimbriimonas ginsengisoli TaxID=1005039 RepID=A0A931LTS5_FIMGI|nr:glycosyltransferase family 9 protein [Fimbriimonas ginsengisoli]MBI3721821.1 glycosyltransferase family 9 protein [Fimbriimonas ginsengisoli]